MHWSHSSMANLHLVARANAVHNYDVSGMYLHSSSRLSHSLVLQTFFHVCKPVSFDLRLTIITNDYTWSELVVLCEHQTVLQLTMRALRWKSLLSCFFITISVAFDWRKVVDQAHTSVQNAMDWAGYHSGLAGKGTSCHDLVLCDNSMNYSSRTMQLCRKTFYSC